MSRVEQKQFENPDSTHSLDENKIVEKNINQRLFDSGQKIDRSLQNLKEVFDENQPEEIISQDKNKTDDIQKKEQANAILILQIVNDAYMQLSSNFTHQECFDYIFERVFDQSNPAGQKEQEIMRSFRNCDPAKIAWLMLDLKEYESKKDKSEKIDNGLVKGNYWEIYNPKYSKKVQNDYFDLFDDFDHFKFEIILSNLLIKDKNRYQRIFLPSLNGSAPADFQLWLEIKTELTNIFQTELDSKYRSDQEKQELTEKFNKNLESLIIKIGLLKNDKEILNKLEKSQK